MPRIDFHCHSNRSDGFLAPERVVEALGQAGVAYAALTDHDTTAGLEIFRDAATRRGIETVSGVEITAMYCGGHCHLLAYGFDAQSDALQGMLDTIRRESMTPERAMLEAVSRFWRRAFRKTTANGERDGATASNGSPEIAQIIQSVHAAGGLVFLAHPLILERDPEKLDERLGELAALGLDGIEAQYKPYAPETREALSALARRRGLLVCAGSDFHGAAVPGLSNPGIEPPEACWQALCSALERARKQANG